jgi:hypothetical protein
VVETTSAAKVGNNVSVDLDKEIAALIAELTGTQPEGGGSN